MIDTLFSAIDNGLALDMVYILHQCTSWACLPICVCVCSPPENDIQSAGTEDIHLVIWCVWDTLGHFIYCRGTVGIIVWCLCSNSVVYIAYKKPVAWPSGTYCYLWISEFLSVLLAELPVAINTAKKSTVPVPSIFKYPATLLCCGRKRRAECFVTTFVLWVNSSWITNPKQCGYI